MGGQEIPRGKKLTAEQIIGKLREAEVELARGKTVPEVVRKIGVTEQTYYRWKREYVGLRTDQAKRLKDLEQENARLDRLPRLLGRAGKVRCRQPEHVNDSMAAWESYAKRRHARPAGAGSDPPRLRVKRIVDREGERIRADPLRLGHFQKRRGGGWLHGRQCTTPRDNLGPG